MHKLASRAPYALAILRIAIALLFFHHGTVILFGFPQPLPGLPSPLPWLFAAAGVFELAGGALFAVGLWTRTVAFILSGQMAVGYFLFHASRGFWPALNDGDAAILYCWIFAYFVFAGAGKWSLDDRLGKGL